MGYYKTNCRQAVPRVVRGNDFTAMVLVTRRVPSEGGKETEPVNLSRCTGITARRVTRLGRRTEMGFSIDGSYLVVPFDDELPSGSYGFEATGKYANGRDWALRLMPGEFVDIVEPSSAGYTDGSEERDVYEFAAVVLGESMSEAQMDRMNAAIETARAAAEEAAGLTEAMMSGEAERQAAEKLREDNVNDVRERVVTLEDKAAEVGGKVATLDGDETVEGSVRKRVKDAVERLVGAAPDTLDTLQKIAEEMQNPESNAAKTVLDQVAGKADKATTLGGYGITDAYTKAEADEMFVKRSGAVLYYNVIKDL